MDKIITIALLPIVMHMIKRLNYIGRRIWFVGDVLTQLFAFWVNYLREKKKACRLASLSRAFLISFERAALAFLMTHFHGMHPQCMLVNPLQKTLH